MCTRPALHDIETDLPQPGCEVSVRGDGDLWLHATTFTIWTVAVAVATFLICSYCLRSSSSASEDYFVGGRALTWYIVAGSLMLTNLSTEQLVGLNGVVFKDGCLAGTGWETFAALAMCVTASVFLPQYMSLGLSTTTGFLGERFNLVTRTLVSSVFLLYYAFGLCPSVLYTGALAIRNIFELESVPLWQVSLVIGIIGACYALFGGLKAVAVSDCLNGVGLVIVGLWVPIASLLKMGGLQTLFAEPQYLRPLVETSNIYADGTHRREPGQVSLPWSVYITGLTLNNLYYWSTNQLIVQRVLAAQSLAHGQKGVLFAALMKVVGFTFLCLPGIIGMLLVDRGEVDGKQFVINRADSVYPELVKFAMPRWSLGFFAAVLLGSVLSTFNSALNSASTLFGLEIYKIFINPEASDTNVVNVASFFGASLTVVSLLVAPQLEGVESIFDFLQRLKTMSSLPIITIFVVGILCKYPDAFSAIVAFTVGAVAYGAGQFLEKPHFLHVFFACFLVALATMMLAAFCPLFRRCFCQPAKPTPYKERVDASVVDIKPWAGLLPMAGMVCLLVTTLTISLQFGSIAMFSVFVIMWLFAMVALAMFPVDAKAVTGGGDLAESEEGSDDSEEETSSSAAEDDRGSCF